jgi:agmatinase
MAKKREYKGEIPLHDKYGPKAKYAVEAEALLPTAK